MGNEETNLNDPEIGELKFILKKWASSDDDLEFEELKKRKCTDKDFENVDGKPSDYGFFEMDDATRQIV